MTSNTKMSDGETPDKSGSSDGPLSEDPAPTALVWLARFLTVGALLAIVGYLVWLISTDNRPAQFIIDADYAELDLRNGQYVLPIRVVNDSTEAVTNVVLDAALSRPGEEAMNLSTTLPLMGEGESAMLEMVFETEPSPETLKLRVSSYQSP